MKVRRIFKFMFCPGCGIEEKKSNQFCRACGTDLRPAQKVLEMPDIITASADTAREEIGRAFAAKIRDTQDATDLKIVAEDVLPQIEKFLESPEEKRLRRMRVGTIIALVGFGVAFALSLVSLFIHKDDIVFLAGLGLVTFFIGLSFVINGLIFTVPKRRISDKSSDANSQRELDADYTPPNQLPNADTNELILPESSRIFPSVTEQTTRLLKEKQTVSRK